MSKEKSYFGAKLSQIIKEKNTPLALSADVKSSSQLIDLIKKTADYVCIVKTHCDAIIDFNQSTARAIKKLAKDYNFLILEDRKFADIGNTTYSQITQSPFYYLDWVDAFTMHSVAGVGCLQALEKINKNSIAPISAFVLAQMSCQTPFFTEQYSQTTAQMVKDYDCVAGFIAQRGDFFSRDDYWCLTPGVSLDKKGDGLSQQYNHPSQLIKQGSDVLIVGRAITQAKDPKFQCQRFLQAIKNTQAKS